MSDEQVRWESQQRVDQPDLAAMSELSQRANRRRVRELFAGADETPRILRGFQVKAEDSGVSPRIIVTQTDTAITGAFVSALNVDGATFDFGTVGGEGAAQRLLDFTGQAPATFEVKIRARELPVQQDNRAFWNPGSNEEFVKVTNTRIVPEWEIAFSGHSDADWQLLADVIWDGSDIETVDITDKRDFAFEGTAPYRATDPASGFGIGDFDRSVGRGDAKITLPGTVEAVRAVMRQVQDIKGPDKDGFYSSYSRPPGALGIEEFGVTAELHSNLNTVQSVTYTVGDEEGQFGDFSGVTGLQDCLAFIVANATSLPGVITIAVRSGRTTVFTLTTNIVIPGKLIRIIGVTAGANVSPSSNETREFDHKVFVEVDVPVSTIAIEMTDFGSLYLENVFLQMKSGSTGNLVKTNRGGTFRSKNVTLGADFTTGFALRVGHHGLAMDSTLIFGEAWIGGRDPWGDKKEVDQSQPGGRMDNCRFYGNLKLRHIPTPISEYEFAHSIALTNCEFHKVSLVSDNAFGLVDARGGRNLRFQNCTWAYSGNEDGLRFGTMEPQVNSFVTSSKCLVDSCDFGLIVDATHDGQQSGDPGVSGALGTGWALKMQPDITVDEVAIIPTYITVRNNTFRVSEKVAGFFDSSPDAGAIFCGDCRNIHIEGNSIVDWTEPSVFEGRTDTQAMVFIGATSSASVAFGGGSDIWYEDNFIGRWQENSDPGLAEAFGSWGGTGPVHGLLLCLHLLRARKIYMCNNTYSGEDASGAPLVPHTISWAMRLRDTHDILMDGDRYQVFRKGQANFLPTVTLQSGGDTNIAEHVSFLNVEFRDCDESQIKVFDALLIEFLTIRNCTFYGADSRTNPVAAIDLIAATATIDRLWIEDNKWDHTAGILRAVNLGTPTIFSYHGNVFLFGNIKHDSGVGPFPGQGLGYNVGLPGPPVVPDTNIQEAYV